MHGPAEQCEASLSKRESHATLLLGVLKSASSNPLFRTEIESCFVAGLLVQSSNLRSGIARQTRSAEMVCWSNPSWTRKPWRPQAWRNRCPPTPQYRSRSFLAPNQVQVALGYADSPQETSVPCAIDLRTKHIRLYPNWVSLTHREYALHL